MSITLDTRLDVLKKIIDKNQKRDDRANYDKFSEMYDMVLYWISKKSLVLYGGYALDLLLPKIHKIYDPKTLPDADCFSDHAREHAKELALDLKKAGYNYVEVKAGLHKGTYKVFAEFMPIADITQVGAPMFKYLAKNCIKTNDLMVCPAQFLMWSLYKEMARPKGSAYRWEKIYPRYLSFHRHYKFKDHVPQACQNEMSPIVDKLEELIKEKQWPLIGHRAVGIHIGKECRPMPEMYAFDIMTSNVDETFAEIKKALGSEAHITLVRYPSHSIKEVAPKISFVKFGHNETRLCKLYEVDSCYSYQKKNGFLIGSVDTVLHFLYSHYITASYYKGDDDRLTKIVRKLIVSLEKYANNLEPNQRFRVDCIGYEKTMVNVKKELWTRKLFNFRPE
jgi:hypothetical protein